MSYYINILTVYDCTPEIQSQVETVLHTNASPFQRVESTFFVGTPFKTTLKKIVQDLTATGLKFTCCHTAIKTGSELHGSIAPETLAGIRDIFYGK